MRATIGIATCAPHAGLARLLESLAPQLAARRDCEALVVDNTPGTNAPLAVPAWARAVRCATPGLHAARHTVLRHARGAVLLYVDDDCEVAPGWLEALLARFDETGVVLATGPALPVFATPPPAWVEDLWHRFPGGRFMTPLSLLEAAPDVRWLPASLAFGLNFAIRRATLIECGGFRPDALPRDRLLQRGDGEGAVTAWLAARGVRAAFVPQAIVHHHIPAARLTLAALGERSYREGITLSYQAFRRAGGRWWAAALLAGGRAAAAAALPAARGRRIWNRGRLRGVLDHLAALRRYPELVQWAMRPDYLADHD